MRGSERLVLEELTEMIIGEAIAIHDDIGSGAYESVYETLLGARLERRGLEVIRQPPVRIEHDGFVFENAFRADMVVARAVVVEIKSVEKESPAHYKQLVTYVKLLGLPVGLLLNFGAPTLKEGIRRAANTLRASATPRLRANGGTSTPTRPGGGGLRQPAGRAMLLPVHRSEPPMPMPSARVSFEGVTPILPVLDLRASIEYYTTKLGFRIDWDYGDGFASVSRDGCAIMLCEGGQGHPGTWVWVGVGDAARLHEEYRASGAKVRHPPTNYSWAYEMQVEDLDGNVLRMGSEPREGMPIGEWLDMHGRRWTPLGNEQWTLDEGG